MAQVKNKFLFLLKSMLAINSLVSCSNMNTSQIVDECTSKVISYVKQKHIYETKCLTILCEEKNDLLILEIYANSIDNAKKIIQKDDYYIFNKTDFEIDGDPVRNIPKEDEIWLQETEFLCAINQTTNNYIILECGEGTPDFNCILQLQEFIRHPETPFKGIEEALVDEDCVGTPPPPPIVDSLQPNSRK